MKKIFTPRRSPISNLKEIHLSTCFSLKKPGVTMAIPTVTYGWPPSSGVGSRAKGMAERKERQAEEDTEEERERERYTHTHIHTHSRSYNDDYNDNIITTIIIFIPSSSPFSLTLFLSLLLSFISNFLRTHSHEKICKKKFHHSSLSLPLLLFFFSSFRSSGAQL